MGEKIDPRDWEIGTTPDKILEQVLEQKDDGHMILLHDGGGDRTPTLAALPQIIDTLRAQGYQFVPLGEADGADARPVDARSGRRTSSAGPALKATRW